LESTQSHFPGQRTAHKKHTLKVHSLDCLLIYCQLVCLLYGDSAGNTVEENSRVFSLIRMR